MPLRPFIVLASLLGLGSPTSGTAGDVHVAVAANFAAPMKIIADEFQKTADHRALLSFGATGKFYAQIINGAPFDVFLAADVATPDRLEREGFSVPGSRVTYAVGRLALWSANPDFVDDRGAILKRGAFHHIALAAPKLAPYGAAAVETLEKLDLLDTLRPKFVLGENIAQAYQFVATGNADLGFVALSQVYSDGKLKFGSGWIVPSGFHAPLRQDAVILSRGANNPAAPALIRFLQSPRVRAILESHGYGY